jgi:hypothetical protein
MAWFCIFHPTEGRIVFLGEDRSKATESHIGGTDFVEAVTRQECVAKAATAAGFITRDPHSRNPRYR